MATKKKFRQTAPKKAARKQAPARKKAKRPAGKKAAATPLHGSITHTEFASTNPDATKAWMAKALGWKFGPSMPTPDGPYHLFRYSEHGGGGITMFREPEATGTVPYVGVANAQKAVDKAVAAGAQVIMPVTKIMDGATIAIVLAPGGVMIGFAGS